MAIGRVKNWHPSGYAFLSNEDGSKDVFAHANDCGCATPLNVGDYFEFDIVESKHKPGKRCAQNLRRLDRADEEKEKAWEAHRPTDGQESLAWLKG